MDVTATAESSAADRGRPHSGRWAETGDGSPPRIRASVSGRAGPQECRRTGLPASASYVSRRDRDGLLGSPRLAAHCSTPELCTKPTRGEIRHRLQNEALPEAQRIYWAAAGFLLAPGRYSRELQEFANEPARLGPLLDFQYRIGSPDEVARRFATRELKLLIEMTGVAMAGVELTAARREVMAGLIRGLSRFGTQEPPEILQELKDAPAFAPWATDILVAIEDQSERRRMAEFRLCRIDLIAKTLENGRPANAGDLAELVVDQGGLVSEEIRDGSASSWKQFWNVDGHNRATDPRPEAACRDVILSALQRRLDWLGIDAQPEGRYADDKRSDIRFSFGSFNVPMEIKRSCHLDLWTAMRHQLVVKYTRDPGTDGSRVYLVFWFG